MSDILQRKKERSVLILPGSHMQDVHVRFRLHLDQVRTELKDIEKLQQWPSLLCGNCVEQAFHQELNSFVCLFFCAKLSEINHRLGRTNNA